MAQVNTSLVEAAVVETLFPKVETALEQSSLTWNKIKKGTPHEINSRSAGIVIRVKNNANYKLNNQSNGADFPTASTSTFQKFTVPFIDYTKSIDFSGHVFAENENTKTLVDLIAGELTNGGVQVDKNMNQLVWSDGTAEIARVSGVAALVVTCNGSTNLYGSRWTEDGMEVEFRTTAGVLRSGGGISYGTILSRLPGSKTFTLDQIPTDVANTDIVYPRGSYNNGPRGILYHSANTGAWQGAADRTLFSGINPAIYNASSAALSATIIDFLRADASYKSGAPVGKMVITSSPSQKQAYNQAGYEFKRFATNKNDQGFEVTEHGGSTWDEDMDCPLNQVIVGDIGDTMMRFELRKVGLEKFNSGSMFIQKNASSGQGHADAKMCYFKGYFNWGAGANVKMLSRIHSLSVSGLATGSIA